MKVAQISLENPRKFVRIKAAFISAFELTLIALNTSITDLFAGSALGRKLISLFCLITPSERYLDLLGSEYKKYVRSSKNWR